jgi:hypothetical protein
MSRNDSMVALPFFLLKLVPEGTAKAVPSLYPEGGTC